MNRLMLLLIEQVMLFGKFCRDSIGNSIPWFLEKHRLIFSVSRKDYPSTIQATINEENTASPQLSTFIFVKNHADTVLYLTEAHFRMPTKWRKDLLNLRKPD